MIIEEVEIENFRSHQHTKLDFDQGITVIIGENGSGKTSILDAINFALFKQKPDRVNMDDTIRRGSKEAKVTVIFHTNSRIFKVVRGRRLKKAVGSVLYELNDSQEIPIAEGEDEITDEINKILNLNGEIFTSAIYIRQGEIDSLLSETPSARKVHIGKLLGTEDLENAHRHMRDLIDIYKIKISSMQNIHDAIKKVKGAIEEGKSAISELKSELSSVSEKLKIKKPIFEEKEKNIKLLDVIKDLESALNENKIKRDNLSEKIENLTQYERILKETEDAHTCYIKIEDEIEKLKEKKEAWIKYLVRDKSLKEDLNSNNKKLIAVTNYITNTLDDTGKIFESKIESYRKLEKLTLEGIKESQIDIKRLLNEKEKLTTLIGKRKGNNEEIKRNVEDLKSAKDQCPVCSARLTSKHKAELLADYSKKQRKNEKHLLVLKKKLVEYSKEEPQLEKFVQELRMINLGVIKSKFDEKVRMEEEIKKTEIAIEKNKKFLEESELLKKELKKKEVRKERLKEENEQYIGAKQFLRKNLPKKEDIKLHIKKLENKIEKLQAKIEKISEKIGYKPEVSSELESLKDERRRLLEDITKLEKAKSGGESVIREKERLMENLKRELKELEEKRIEFKKLVEFKTFLEKVRGFFHKDVLQKELRVRSMPLVEGYTREVFDRFDLPYSDLTLTEDFDLVVYGPLGEASSEMLSGGERIASALALRIGIAKALSGSPMELIILDEPTTHLDALRRRDLVEIIKRLSSIPQTIVVTHDKEFENAADTLIEVEKVEGISKVRYAE